MCYINLVPDATEIHQGLLLSEHQLTTLVEKLPEEVGDHRYAEGKWSIKELLVHLTDTERIFANRALRSARGDKTPLPGFEQDDYVPTSAADGRSLDSIMEERNAVRLSTILLFKSFHHNVLGHIGQADGKPMSVRAIGYILAGHDLHHLQVINERYL
jgi:hypothetical protein